MSQALLSFDAVPRLPQGFSCAAKHCGIKEGSKEDLALFYSSVPAAAAAVFTRNLVPGAPIIAGRQILKRGRLQAVVVNSRVSNVGTGEEGVRRAYRMSVAAARELACDENEVLPSSTGVIAIPLPVEKIENGLVGMKALLGTDPLVGAKGIMTTDSHPKAISITTPTFTLSVIAKGSGMIEPNMATMLCYIFTDARIDAATLDTELRAAVHDSFNMLSVDGDTSTSDTCVIMANGLAGEVKIAEFRQALHQAAVRMTEILARDGEGATKLLKATVHGAVSDREARIFARSIINSPLIKTMAHGCDPNIGRMLMALGKCFDNTLEYDKIRLSVNGTLVFAKGQKTLFDEKALRASLGGECAHFVAELGLGDFSATSYGCDLSHGYIDENGAYYSS